jgi:hypothetical protein
MNIFATLQIIIIIIILRLHYTSIIVHLGHPVGVTTAPSHNFNEPVYMDSVWNMEGKNLSLYKLIHIIW